VATIPAATTGSGGHSWGDSKDPTAIEVGEGDNGEGVIVTHDRGTVPVPGTSDLESVSCTTATQCYAVGLGPSNDDEGVLVSIANGEPTATTPLPAFIGLYGISCPTATTCYAVGYDNASDADAVTTITNGQASSPVDVSGGGEWLNAISCPSATQCYAAGLVNYNPSIVPVTSGTPGAAVTIGNFSDSWYVSGLDCTSVGDCVAVGENASEQGIVSTFVNGAAGTTTVVPGTEYLYGVGCATNGDCVLAGTSSPGANGYNTGAVSYLPAGGTPSPAIALPRTNGFGQLACGTTTDACVSVGAVENE
jgi:hypothetical protein